MDVGSIPSEQAWPSDRELAPIGVLEQLNGEKLRLLRAGADLIDCAMFNPDLPPPRLLLDKLVEATLKPSMHRYAVSRGIKKLREAFALKYLKVFGVRVDPEREVCVTMGAKDALHQALRVLGRPGAKVLLGAPAYPAHVAAVNLSGMIPCSFALATEEGELLSNIEAAIVHHAPRVLLLNFPHNPTGTVMERSFFEKLREVVGRALPTPPFVINDFVYGEMGFSGLACASIMIEKVTEGFTEIYSLSKAYSVPGWRVGALIGPASVIEPVAQLKAHLDYGTFLPLQNAAAAALQASTEIVRPQVDTYRSRARVLLTGLRRLDFEVSEPHAGGVVWARSPEWLIAAAKEENISPALVLLARAGIVATPGPTFGVGFDDWIRLALVQSVERLQELVERVPDAKTPVSAA